MPNLYNWKKVKVPVTVHLTEEAALILHQYAGDRGKGDFLSALLVAQRRYDDLEIARIEELTKLREAAATSGKPQNSATGHTNGNGKKKGR